MNEINEKPFDKQCWQKFLMNFSVCGVGTLIEIISRFINQTGKNVSDVHENQPCINLLISSLQYKIK